jgi:hypothetical protein
MKNALLLYSWRGLFQEEIEATAITSRSDARKLAPFVDFNHKQLLWVNWTYLPTDKRWRKAHFRHYPKGHGKLSINRNISQEITKREKYISESDIHKSTKETIATFLRKLLDEQKGLTWSFLDKRNSSFSLSGNLLSNVVSVETEYAITTPFNKKYRLDIALLGEKIYNKQPVLAGIEVEFSNEFELLKCLICKAAGFPLLSVDLTDFDKNEITKKICIKRLLETTKNSGDKRRRNYVYIHNMLYPLFLDTPQELNLPETHQFIIFADDSKIEDIVDKLNILRRCLNLSKKSVLVQPVNCTNEQMKAMLENEGSIAGHDWRDYNDKRYIRLILEKPRNKKGNLYQYHIVMSNLLNSHYQTLVGYKYRSGIHNENVDEHTWGVYQPSKKQYVSLVPKHVSEPVLSILNALEQLEK